MRSFVVAALALSSASSLHATTERLLGFHPAGDVAYVLVDDANLGKVVRVCRLRTDSIPDAWPPAVSVADGTACAVLTDDAAGAPAADFAKNAIAGATTLKVSPWGITIALETTADRQVLKASSGKETDGGKTIELLPVLTSPAPLKIVEVRWRTDGRAAAVSFEPVEKAGKGAVVNRELVVVDVSPLLIGGPAGRKLAQAKVKEAEALLKKRQWGDAGAVLDVAIAADPNLASAHYQRAAAEAQSGVGLSTMLANLSWLKSNAATDPTAEKLLAGAQKDKAFDAWVGEAEVREIIGLPALKEMTSSARLLERGAVWTRQGATCKTPWITLSFSKGDKGTLEVAESCKGKKTKQRQAFTWKSDATTTTLTTAAKEVGDLKLPAVSTVELDGTYQQVRLSADGLSSIGPFEPGIAWLDDSV